MTNAVCVRTEPLSTISSIIAQSPLNRESLPGPTTTSFITSTRQSPPDSTLTIVLKFCVTSKNSPKANPPLFLFNAVTNLIPDICLFWKACKKLVIIELTVAFELNIEKKKKKNHKRKVDKYTALVLDIKSKGFECDIIALEIGSRGYVSPDNQQRLKSILKLCINSVSFKNFRDDLSKLSILSSFSIYHTHKEPSWDNYPLLSLSWSWARLRSTVLNCCLFMFV